MFTDIHTLADEVLASVQEGEVKLASEQNVDSPKTEIGAHLKKVAAQLRQSDDASNITYADLMAEPVKTASFSTSASTGKTELSQSLREVASVLRHTGIEKSAAKRENAARILRAARGLTTLTKGPW